MMNHNGYMNYQNMPNFQQTNQDDGIYQQYPEPQMEFDDGAPRTEFRRQGYAKLMRSASRSIIP